MAVFTHRQLWESIADEIREEILDGRRSARSRLHQTDLAEIFQVSRGPIRDALNLLVHEGLAENVPRRGTFVSSLTERDLDEVYVLRRAIDVAAVPFAIERATEDEIAEMMRALQAAEDAWHVGDRQTAWEADMAFHRSYCAMSGNGRLLTICEELGAQTVLLMRTLVGAHAPFAHETPVGLNRGIAYGIRDRDPKAAIEAVHVHYDFAQNRLEPRDIKLGQGVR